MGIGVQQSSEPAERTSSIPVPGSVVSSDDPVRPGELRPAVQQPSYATIGDADMVNQPGLLAQLFPNLLDSILGGRGQSPPMESRNEVRGKRVRGRSTGNSK